MNAQDRGLELKVGLFVFLGLLVLAALVVQFGRVGEGFKTYYPLTVRFPDASGLLKGSDVLLAGAKIGRVSGAPQIVQSGIGVKVPLRIFDYVKIPEASKFIVGSSGLLGDRYVLVIPPAGEHRGAIAADAVVEGTRETGLDDLTRDGTLLIQDLRNTVQNINTTVTGVREGVFSGESMQNFRSSMEHLNQATGSLAESAKKVDGVVEKAKSAMESADATMQSGKKAADDVQLAVADARKTIQGATQIMREASGGKGLLATLLNNPEVSRNLEALISNLRSHGILFYRDSAAKAASAPSPAPGRR